MPKENPSHQPEQTVEDAQRQFIKLEIKSKAIASFIPPSFIEIITDTAMEMKKVTTSDDLFSKARDYDTFMEYKDHRYEKTVRDDYERRMRHGFEKNEKSILKSLAHDMAYVTAKGKMLKENETQPLGVSPSRINQSAALCEQLTRTMRSTIIPNPKYL